MTPALKKALELHQPGIGAGAAIMATQGEEAYAAARRLNTIRESILSEDWPKKVQAFMTLYGQPVTDRPGLLTPEQAELEEKLVMEECDETLKAAAAGDLVETVDGLIDTIYVSLHWLLTLGFSPVQINQLITEVHASNMTKTDDEGKPVIADGSGAEPLGKVLKGPNFTRPSIFALLLDWGFPVGDMCD